jgi:hypothetical protein
MLTYLSTLRSKTGFCLVRPKNAYFANSLNTSHRLRFALASLRKATPRPASDGGQRVKGKRQKIIEATWIWKNFAVAKTFGPQVNCVC